MDSQPIYLSYSTPDTEIFDQNDSYESTECFVCQCNPCQCNPYQWNPCQCNLCQYALNNLLRFTPITIDEYVVVVEGDDGNGDGGNDDDVVEYDTKTIYLMDDTIVNANDHGINYGFVVIGDKKIFKRLTIPFYCFSSNPVTYKQLSVILSNYIVTYSQENYYTVDKTHEVGDYIVFTLSFFSDSGLNFVGFTNNLNDTRLRNYYYQCNIICKIKDQVFLIQRQGFDTLFASSYLWERDELKLKELKYDDEDNIVSYGDKFEEAFTFPTFHKYTNKNYFQPLLGDVFNQIPWNVQVDGPFLITTEMISNNPELIVRGDYHVGKTTIYTLVPNRSNKKQKLEY